MKKKLKKNKGFAMAELLAVSVGVLFLFSILFSNYLPLLAEFEQRLSYNNVTAEYAAHYIRQVYYKSGIFENNAELISNAIDNSVLGYIDNNDLCGDAGLLKGVENGDQICTKIENKIGNIKKQYGDGEENNSFKILVTKYKLKYDSNNKYTNSNDALGIKNKYVEGKLGTDSGLIKYIKYLPDYSKSIDSRTNKELYRIIVKIPNFGYATSPILSDQIVGNECFEAKKDNNLGGLVITDFIYSKNCTGDITITSDNYVIKNSNGTGMVSGKIVGIEDGEVGKGVFTPTEEEKSKGFNLTKIDIDYEGFKKVGDYAFEGTALSNVSLGDYGASDFPNGTISKIVIDTNSEYAKYGEGAFSNIKTLNKVLLSTKDVEAAKDDATKSIYKDGIFKESYNKDSDNLDVALSEEVIKVPNSMFEGTKIGKLDLGAASKLETIGSSAFKEANVTAVTLPVSVTTIEKSAFDSNRIQEFELKENVTKISDSAFAYNSSLKTIIINDNSSLKSIGNEAFMNCDLISIKIPNELETIGEKAFSNNKNLGNVEIEDSANLTTIGVSAFEGCSNLNNFTIPKNVKSIGKDAFKGVRYDDTNLFAIISYSTYFDDKSKLCVESIFSDIDICNNNFTLVYKAESGEEEGDNNE